MHVDNGGLKMYYEFKENDIEASKNLSRIWSKTNSSLMETDTGWCRVIYSEYDKFIQKEHKHTSFEMHCMLEGKLNFIIDGKKVEVSEGEFVIIPPHTLHSTYYVAPKSKKFVYLFNLEGKCNFVLQALKKLEEIKVYKIGEHIPSIIRMMLDYSYPYTRITDEMINRLVECMLIEIFSIVRPFELEKFDELVVFESDKRVSKAKQYISDNISSEISAADVSKHLNLSVRQLDRITKNNTGYTVTQLIVNEKMKHIKELLKSDMSLEEIAEQTHFSSKYSLYRFFMHNEGRSIGVFRRDIEKPFKNESER